MKTVTRPTPADPAVGPPPTPASAAHAAEARRRRATVAQRLIDLAPAAAAALDWDALDQAPDWLGLPDAAFVILQSRVGALLYAPALRLWIDGPRLAAARVLLGAAVLDDLLAQPESAMPRGLANVPRIDAAAQVGPLLKAAGTAVLLAALPAGTLREAVCQALAPVLPSPMSHELAETLISRARALGQGSPTRVAEGAWSVA
jgi:hypothetical protein